MQFKKIINEIPAKTATKEFRYAVVLAVSDYLLQCENSINK